MIKTTLLGSGGAFDPLSTSFLIDDTFLIDCGNEVIKKYSNFTENSILDNVKYLFLTHSHNDHIGGLETLLYYLLVKNNMEDLDLSIYGNQDCLDFFLNTAIFKEYKKLEREDFVKFILIPNFESIPISFSNDNLLVTSVKTAHMLGNILSNAFIFTRSDMSFKHTVIITGDLDSVHSDFTPEIVNSPLTILFHDVGWTGLPSIEGTNFSKVHPTEKEVFDFYGNSSHIIGIHTSSHLKYFKKGEAEDIFFTSDF